MYKPADPKAKLEDCALYANCFDNRLEQSHNLWKNIREDNTEVTRKKFKASSLDAYKNAYCSQLILFLIIWRLDPPLDLTSSIRLRVKIDWPLI